MKMKMPTGVVVSQPSRLAYNQAPSTPLNEMFPQACSSEHQVDEDDLADFLSNEFSSQTHRFNESLTTNLTEFMQGLQDLFVCASSSQDQSSWQTEPVPDPVYTRILATIEMYAAAHPGPDPAHYRCGTNHPQYIGSDDPQIISMLQHDDYNWKKSSPVINNLPYWDIPNQGDTCRNGQYTKWNQYPMVFEEPSIQYSETAKFEYQNQPLVCSPKCQLVAPLQITHYEIMKQLIVDEETVALDIQTIHTEKCVITVTSSNLHVIEVVKPPVCTATSTIESVPTAGMEILPSAVGTKPPEVAKLDTLIACVSKYEHFQSEELYYVYTEGTVMGIVQILITYLSLLRLSSNYCATYSSDNPNVGSGRVEGHPDPYNLTAREKQRFHVKNKWWVSTYGWDSHCSGIKTLVSPQGLLYSLQTNVLP